MKTLPNHLLGVLASIGCISFAYAGPIVIDSDSTSYVEDFDSLEAVTAGDTSFTQWVGWTQGETLTGWYRQLSNNNTDKDYIGEPVGSSNIPRFLNAGDGGTYVADVETDRALGAMSGNGVSIAFGPMFKVAEGMEVNGVSLGYTAEQWFRTPTNTPTDNLEFQYKILDSINAFKIYEETGWTAVSNLDWNQAVDLPREASGQRVDGNGDFFSKPVSGAVTFASPVLEGQFIAFRWISTTPADNNVSAAMCVDDLTMDFDTNDNPAGGSGNRTIKIYTSDFNYEQDFNALESGAAAGTGVPLPWRWQNGSTLTGWYRDHTVDDIKDYVGEPSAVTVRFINGGDGGTFSGDTTERALGALTRANNDVAFGPVFEVVGNVSITSATIDYTAEQWFRTTANTPTDNLQFQYKILDSLDPATFNIQSTTGWTSVTELDWNVADSLPIEAGSNQKSDGNTDFNSGFVPGPSSFNGHTITFPTPLTTGQYIAFRWLLEGPDDNSDTAAMLVDDLSIDFSGTNDSSGSVSVSADGSTVSLTLGIESTSDFTTGFSDVSNITVVTDDPVNNPSNGKVILQFDSGGEDNVFLRIKGE